MARMISNFTLQAQRVTQMLTMLCILLFGPLPALADQDRGDGLDSPGKVLFVGNSFTFYNNSIQTHLRWLLLNGEPRSESRWFLRTLTLSGGYLPDHQQGLAQSLESKPWDVVILQGQSREPLEASSSGRFVETARSYRDQIRAASAEPVLFMTWAYAHRPEMTAELDQVYSRIGRELGRRWHVHDRKLSAGCGFSSLKPFDEGAKTFSP